MRPCCSRFQEGWRCKPGTNIRWLCDQRGSSGVACCEFATDLLSILLSSYIYSIHDLASDLQDAWHAWMDNKERIAAAKIERNILNRWKKLIKFLVTRERLLKEFSSTEG